MPIIIQRSSPMETAVKFDYPGELEDAIDLLMQMRPSEPPHAAEEAPGPSTTPPPPNDADIVRLHRQMEANQSRRFIEVLTSEPLTFEQLAKLMPKKDGTTHSNASMRAVHRNVRRKEQTLKKRGVISHHVVKSNFDDYDADGAGRYYLAPDALAALDAHLAR